MFKYELLIWKKCLRFCRAAATGVGMATIGRHDYRDPAKQKFGKPTTTYPEGSLDFPRIDDRRAARKTGLPVGQQAGARDFLAPHKDNPRALLVSQAGDRGDDSDANVTEHYEIIPGPVIESFITERFVYRNLVLRVTTQKVLAQDDPPDAGFVLGNVLKFTAQPSNGDQVVVGSNTYTFQTTLTNSAGNVLIDADLGLTLYNLVAAITGGVGSGTFYAAATTANPSCAAWNTETGVIVASITGGAIATTTTSANATWSNGVWAGDSTSTAISMFIEYDPLNVLLATKKVSYVITLPSPWLYDESTDPKTKAFIYRATRKNIAANITPGEQVLDVAGASTAAAALGIEFNPALPVSGNVLVITERNDIAPGIADEVITWMTDSPYNSQATAQITWRSTTREFPGRLNVQQYADYFPLGFGYQRGQATNVPVMIQTWWTYVQPSPLTLDSIYPNDVLWAQGSPQAISTIPRVIHDEFTIPYVVGLTTLWLTYSATSPSWSEYVGGATMLTGTLLFTSASAAVVGTGTLFTTELVVGMQIFGGAYTIQSITDDTHLTLTANWRMATTPAPGIVVYKIDPTKAWVGNYKNTGGQIDQLGPNLWRVTLESMVML